MKTAKQLQKLYIQLWMNKNVWTTIYNSFIKYVEDNVYKGNTTKDRIYYKYGIPLDTSQGKAERQLLKHGSFDQIKNEIAIESRKTDAIIMAKFEEHKEQLNKILTQ